MSQAIENTNVEAAATNVEVITNPLDSIKMDKAGFALLVQTVKELQEQLAALNTKGNRTSSENREMNADDARRIMITDLRLSTTKEAMKVLGLSYGQVYSCRKEFTFKPIHAEMKAAGLDNIWVK